MKKISDDLLGRIANALAMMTGLSYLQVQNLLNEMQKLEEIKEDKPKDNGNK